MVNPDGAFAAPSSISAVSNRKGPLSCSFARSSCLSSSFRSVVYAGLYGSRPLRQPHHSAFGYTDFLREATIEAKFLAVPSAKLAGEELKTLTAEPHLAATPEDHKTAEYVAEKFRAAGLETEIVPYRVLLNQPKVVRVEAFDAAGKLLMTGPTREHVDGDPCQDNPRVVMPFNGSSGSGDVTGEVVYANYGRLEDFEQARRPAHRPARQDRHLSLRRQLSRRQGLPRRAARRGRRAHLL